MRRYMTRLSMALALAGGSWLHAQQPQQAPQAPQQPAQMNGNMAAGGGQDIYGIQQNAPVRLQPNQHGMAQRNPNLQGLPAPNPLDPHHARLPNQQNWNNQQGQNNQQGGNQQGGQQGGGGQAGLSLQDQLLLGSGGGYSSGNMFGAVTVTQAEAMAAADVLRSTGSYNRDTAAAGVLDQRAKSEAIDNYANGVKTYFDVRQLNRQERNAERGRVPTQEDTYRYSQSRVPARLPLVALDRQTGLINWPAALTGPEFDDHRARLEQIFQGRSYYNSGVASQSYLEIRDEVDRMLVTLQGRVAEMDPTAYVQAKKFVVGLGYEARFPAGERVAMGG